MKKILLIAIPSLILLSCGGEANETTDSSTDPGSIIAVENPTEGNNTTVNTEVQKDASPGSDLKTTSIEFIEAEHNFGNVFYPSENMFTFKFKNTGSEPLTIISATASCGCTIPNKPEEPILPGAEGEIDVIFRPKEGQIGTEVNKKITVTANTEPAESYVNITAKVLKSM